MLNQPAIPLNFKFRAALFYSIILPVFLFVFCACAAHIIPLKTPDLSDISKYQAHKKSGSFPSDCATQACNLRITFPTVPIMTAYKRNLVGDAVPQSTYMLNPVLKSMWEQVLFDLWNPAGPDVITSFQCKLKVHSSKLTIRGKSCKYELILFATLYAPNGKQLIGRSVSYVSSSPYNGIDIPDAVATACYETAINFSKQVLNTPSVLNLAKNDCGLQQTMASSSFKHRIETQLPVAASFDSKAIGNKINRRWALVIGISKYKSSGINPLSYADADAEAFHDQLREFGWLKSRTRLLTNAKATKQNIEIALESWLSEALPNDLILLFWAGHGIPDPANMEHVYFVCYDTIPSIPATGYRMDRVVESLKERGVRNVVVLADTCHAGKLSTRGSRGIRVNPYVDGLKKKRRVAKGWIYMTGASTEQEAVEHPAWSNGVFTYVLLNGLRGKADGLGGALDGIVTMGELKDYLQENMPKETRKVLGIAKFPQIVTTTGDTKIWDLTLKK